MTISCTFSPEDNKLRLYASERLDTETYERVKACGFRWAPKQDCFFAPSWSPAREDLLLELCGEIGDEDTTLVERAEDRAERFDDYSDKRAQEAASAHKEVERIVGGIPMGQPILVGHSSERHARRDAKRIENGMRKAVNLWETSKYWEQRAAGAIRHAKYKERPDVRARRIKTLEAEQRKVQRTFDDAKIHLALWSKDGLTREQAIHITNYSTSYESYCFPLADYPREPPASQYEGSMSLYSALTGGVITHEQARDLAIPSYARSMEHCTRWLTHYANRLAYERAMLADAGGTVADQNKPEVGGGCRCWASHSGGWSYIRKVNKVTVTVEDNWGNGGKNFTRTIAFDQLKGVMNKATVDRLRDEGRIIDHPDGTGFFRADAPSPAPEPTPEQSEPEAYEAMREQLKTGVQVAVVEQLFPTPRDLADRMVCLADVKPGERVLEPSAGTGRLLDSLWNDPDFYTNEASYVWAIEQNEALSLALAKRRDPHANYSCGDFLETDPKDYEPFDVVVMNPPFSHEQDLKHITHALGFLRPGGRLVAIASVGVAFHQSKAGVAFRDLIKSYGGTIEGLPDDTFQESGTSVRTVLVHVTMPDTPRAKQPTHDDVDQAITTLSSQAESVMDLVAIPLLAEILHDQVDAAPVPTPMQALADTITTQATKSQAQLTRERLELALLSKKSPTKPQAEPCGLFAQTQGAML